MGKIKEFFEWLFFTNRCEYCGTLLEKGEHICSDCEKSIIRIDGDICHKCGVEKKYCNCQKSKIKYDGITAPFYYNDVIKKYIHRFKFGGYEYLAKNMTIEMAECIKREFPKMTFDKVTYVPFSNEQKLTRKYNQSEILAQNISKILNVPFEPVLIKEYDSKSQHNLRYSARPGNVFGTYWVNQLSNIKDENILLVDDVKTSGATLNECAMVLKINGAKSVYCATVAITQKN